MRVAIVTISDTVSRGARPDASGPAVVERCAALGWKINSTHVVADDQTAIESRLLMVAESGHVDLILTTGGTGIGPRDVTHKHVVARLTPVTEHRQCLTGQDPLAEDCHHPGLAKGIPVGHLGRPEDFGDVVAFVCSEPANYVTGTTVLVDGGRYLGLL